MKSRRISFGRCCQLHKSKNYDVIKKFRKTSCAIASKLTNQDIGVVEIVLPIRANLPLTPNIPDIQLYVVGDDALYVKPLKSN